MLQPPRLLLHLGCHAVNVAPMPDFRAFCAAPDSSPSHLVLSPVESHHLVVVNRARAGDPVVAFDGRGREWTCTLQRADKRAAALVVTAAHVAPPLPYRLTLAQALPKGPAMDAIVRKATEIGAARIIPLVTERTQVHLQEERSEKKGDKWQAAALEACKQCGNPWLPEIRALTTWPEFMRSGEDEELRLMASLTHGAVSLRAALQEFRSQQGRLPQRVVWLIGPEGDFSPAETTAAREAGFIPISLGPLVLRCETAAIYALSIISYELQSTASGAPD